MLFGRRVDEMLIEKATFTRSNNVQWQSCQYWEPHGIVWQCCTFSWKIHGTIARNMRETRYRFANKKMIGYAETEISLLNTMEQAHTSINELKHGSQSLSHSSFRRKVGLRALRRKIHSTIPSEIVSVDEHVTVEKVKTINDLQRSNKRAIPKMNISYVRQVIRCLLWRVYLVEKYNAELITVEHSYSWQLRITAFWNIVLLLSELHCKP
jgi:hypothetical protein